MRKFVVKLIIGIFETAIVIVACVVLFACCALLVDAAKAAPLRCVWIDGTEVECLPKLDVQPVNRLRVIEAPLFADSFGD